MKRHIVLSVIFLMTISGISGKAFAQGGMFATATGNTRFSSETPMENIYAENKKTQVLLNTGTGEIAIRMTMRDFVFPNKLMQEHFNENYMESAKYPTGTFSGKLDQTIDFTKDGTYDASVTGSFTIHGVAKTRTIKGKLKVEGSKITISSDFEVALTDHKIEVPSIVFVKIAQSIKVKSEYILAPYKK
ncbi:YceI family protein [Dyadobacter sp. CY356]|uniref:YceI family protein n=1 Tax=Dyadobacter sp. CY356 TaxID=2906442 RepID=UPI001F369E71|nr:YceI family protein [Dyadobacter sp. CY356]MCF0056629.1 YceI family protein [Dyadobacter sp. CY356]